MEFLKAFAVGGAFCVIGQILIDKTKLTPARILVSYVVMGVILGGIGLYEPLTEFAGAGASVPLTGFGNLLAKGVKEAVDEKGFLGIFTGGLKSAAGGITAAIFAGLLASLIFKPKDKSLISGQSNPSGLPQKETWRILR
jgi:stage V sporulation protein AE